MLSMKSILILAVLLVNTIYCQKENDGKGADKPGDIDVNGHTEPLPEGTTVVTTTADPNTTTVEPPTTTTILTTTSVKPAPTNATTLPTTPTTPTTTPTAPTVPSTTPTVKPNTTTQIPITSTTQTPPKDRHFDGASFIGGIILAVGLMGIAFIAFKYYKARTERNYHTL